MPPGDHYRDNGYFIFRSALPQASVSELLRALDEEVFQSPGEFRRHPRNDYQTNKYVDDRTGRKVVANALLDPHREPQTPKVASAIRGLVCTDHVAALLRSIDGASSHTIHQTIIFFIPPATDMHIDGWGLDSQPFGYSHTLWIPLEQVHLRNGPIAIVPWKLGRFMSPQELGFDRFLQGDDQGTREDYHQYQDRLLAHIRRNHPDCVVPQLEPGDMVLFSSLTPHATLPYNGGYPSRRAMQIMLRDSSRAWASWPQQFREKTANPPDEPRDRIQSVNEQWRILM